MKKRKKFLTTALLLSSTFLFATYTSEVKADSLIKAIDGQSLMRSGNLPKISVSLKELPIKHPGNAPYRDAQASQYKNYINWAYNVGITTGYTLTSYKPDYSVTRGEMAVFLSRLAGSPSYSAPFNVYYDVGQYKTQILWLTATTVTNGTAPYYNPNGAVTRGQMAAFLHRVAKDTGKAPSTAHYDSPFKDVSGNMFANDIGWLNSKKITTGYTPTTFNPDGNVTRGEMATFLKRFYDNVVKANPTPDPTPVVHHWELNYSDFHGNIHFGGLFTSEDAAYAAGYALQAAGKCWSFTVASYD
ncbi:S-layer homology domain-containing protein [Lactococcus petauri]|uniref:S-layer homology domain-containing protein n=1 Tax=Lactococcus petauri TaxID=1940789 RepID=UPI000BBD9770